MKERIVNPKLNENRMNQLRKEKKGLLIGKILAHEYVNKLLTKRHNYYKKLSENYLYGFNLLVLLIIVMLLMLIIKL